MLLNHDIILNMKDIYKIEDNYYFTSHKDPFIYKLDGVAFHGISVHMGAYLRAKTHSGEAEKVSQSFPFLEPYETIVKTKDNTKYLIVDTGTELRCVDIRSRDCNSLEVLAKHVSAIYKLRKGTVLPEELLNGRNFDKVWGV